MPLKKERHYTRSIDNNMQRHALLYVGVGVRTTDISLIHLEKVEL